MENNISSEPKKSSLRQKAEEFISEKHSNKESSLTEFDLQKLNHELEVHQIELEMQNEELKLANERTQIAVDMYKDLYDFAPSGYITISEEGLIMKINLRGAQMIGIDRSRLKNRHLVHFVSHDTKPIFNHFIKNVFQSRNVEVCDLTLFNDNGLPMYVHLSGIVAASIEQCNITIIDITERKRAEEELLLREQQYRLLAESITDVIWVQDIESTKFRYISPSIERQLGYTVEEISKNGLTPTIVPSSLHNFKSIMGKRIERYKNGLQDSFTDEIQHIHKNGNIIWVEINTKLSVNPITGRLEANCVSREITKRKLAEETLQNIIDKNPLSIQIVDTEGYTLKTNPANTKLFGAPPPPDFSIFGDIQSKSEELARLIKQAKSGDVVHLPDIYYNAHDVNPTVPDNPKWIRAIIFPLKDKHGKPERFVLMHEDISERKKAELEINVKNQELFKLNSEKDKLFSIIAHDLRSPFNSFLGLTQIMAEELPTLTLEEIQKISLAMRSSATNLYKLLENLLEWSQIQQGLIPFEPKIINFHETIEESRGIIFGQAENKSIKLEFNIPGNIQVFADNNMLQTVLRNLISNSIKFTKSGGFISITAKDCVEKCIEISIKDNGIGMGAQLLKDLFRTDIHTNRRGTEGEPSTGLGLIICKEFIEKHGGKLWVESEVDQGSTFHFTLPKAEY